MSGSFDLDLTVRRERRIVSLCRLLGETVTTATSHPPSSYARRARVRQATFAQSSLLAAALLRAVALLFAVEFSGLAHTGIDVAAALNLVDHSEDGCDSDDECPPGCLSCHCAHTAPGWAPPNDHDPRHVADYPPVQAATFISRKSVPAQGAVLTPPDRPPRVATVS